MLPATYGRGFANGLRNIAGKDHDEEQKNRMKEVLHVLYMNKDFAPETIHAIVDETYGQYWQSNSGGFFYAKRFWEALEAENNDLCRPSKKQIMIVLLRVVEIITRNFSFAKQTGKHALQSMETAMWLAKEIHIAEGAVAHEFMKKCGECFFGQEEIDQMFWDFKREVVKEPALEYLLRSFVEGLNKQNKPVERYASYLLQNDRGPKD